MCVRVDVCSISLIESGGCLLRGLGSPTLVPASRQIGLLWVLHPSGTLSILSHCRLGPRPHGYPKIDCSVARVLYAVPFRFVPVGTLTTLALRALLAPGVWQMDHHEVPDDLLTLLDGDSPDLLPLDRWQRYSTTQSQGWHIGRHIVLHGSIRQP